MDEADESATDSLNLWTGPGNGAGPFFLSASYRVTVLLTVTVTVRKLLAAATAELVERDRAGHRDVQRLGAARLRDRRTHLAAREHVLG